MGFRAGAAVVVSVAGSPAGRAVADRAGSFEASWPTSPLTPRAALTATDTSCTVTGMLSIENRQPQQGHSMSPPAASGGGAAIAQPPPAGPAQPARSRPAPVLAHRPGPDNRPEPALPARQSDPIPASIPLIPLTGLSPKLYLGLTGALLLAGAALTGLAGRLGHRRERPPTPPSSMAGTLPATPGNA